MSFLSDFHFLRPIWLIFILFILINVYLYEKNAGLGNMKKFFSDHMIKNLLFDSGIKKYFNLFYLMTYSLIVLIICISGPTYKKVDTPFNVDHSKILFAFGLSDSMKQKDILPSRIERSKLKIIDYLHRNKTSKIALSAYSEKSYNLLPLTLDRSIIIPYINAISVDIVPKDGRSASSLESILPKYFSTNEKGQYLVLISDGFEVDDIAKYEILLKKYNLKVLVYGIGLDSSKGSFIKKNKSSLIELARVSNGSYIEASLDSTDIDRLSGQITPYYPSSSNDNIPWEELGYYLSFLLVVPFLVFFRKGATIAALIVLCTFSTKNTYAISLLDPFLTKNQQAMIYFKFEKYDKAASLFEDKKLKAISFYLNEDFKNSEIIFSSLEDKESKFSYANSLAHQGFYLSALEVYEDLIAEFPKDERFKKNFKIMDKLVKEIDELGKSQVSEGHGKVTKKREDPRKVSRGALKEQFEKSSESGTSAKDNLDIWYSKLDSNLEDFLIQKVRILDEKNN